jgi:MraZ protein
VDDKRRVPVPSKWRPDDPESLPEFTLIVWPQHQAGICLRVLPPDQFDKLYDEIEAMPNSDPSKPVLKRNIGTRSAQAKLDNAGRIMIPDEMAEEAGIKGTAVLAGMLDRFEIWNPERFAEVQKMDKPLLGKAFEMME